MKVDNHDLIEGWIERIMAAYIYPRFLNEENVKPLRKKAINVKNVFLYFIIYSLITM